jgi:hypothetical protein
MSNVVTPPWKVMSPAPTTRASGRVSTRHKVHLRFRLHAPDVAEPIDCFVQDLSAFGAKLRLPQGASVPEEGLILESVGDARRCGARVIWRDGQNLGVQLIDPE